MYFREFGERPAGSHGSLVAYTLGLGDVCSRWTQTRGATAGRKKKKKPLYNVRVICNDATEMIRDK